MIGEITEAEIAALRELAKARKPYKLRPASCYKLEIRGFANPVGLTAKGYQITETGRIFLRSLKADL